MQGQYSTGRGGEAPPQHPRYLEGQRVPNAGAGQLLQYLGQARVEARALLSPAPAVQDLLLFEGRRIESNLLGQWGVTHA